MAKRLLLIALTATAVALMLVLAPAHASSNVSWAITVRHIEPFVGETVEIEAAALGNGGLPQYTLRLVSSPALLSIDDPASMSPGGSLGIPVTWHLTALHPGVQTFNVFLSYEKQTCDDQEPPVCFFTFVSAVSQTYSVIVQAGAGDADCDGKVTSLDAALALQNSAGLIEGVPCDLGSDPNGDDEWNAVDAALILQFVAGLIPHFV